MNIERISESFFLNKIKEKITVSIIDSGFYKIPEYAKIYGFNKNPTHQHGNRILSIFTALDKKYPIDNLSLNLSCYNPADGYGGLLFAIEKLPDSDILSMSISWKQDKQEIYQLMKKKAKIICAPYSSNTITPYPSAYSEVITCSNTKNNLSLYSICPNTEWSGNSYSVPAIARLLCYNEKIENDPDGIPINKLFSNNIQEIKFNKVENTKELICPYCKRILRTKYHTLMIEMPENCPYCGYKI